jgi:hypothetical protein
VIRSRMFPAALIASVVTPVSAQHLAACAAAVQTGEIVFAYPAVNAAVRAIAADPSDDAAVRERASRVVRHPDGDAFLRELYGRLMNGDLKDRVIRVVGEDAGAEGCAGSKTSP